MKETKKMIVRCPKCDWRIFDKVTPASGMIEAKCPNCHKVVLLDLSSVGKSDVKQRVEAYAENLKKIATTK